MAGTPPEPRQTETRNEVSIMRPFAVALFLLALVPACSTESTSSPTRMLSVKASLDTLWTRFAFAADAHDAGGFGLLFTDEATLALSGVPTKKGRAEIEECLGALYSGVDATALRIDHRDMNAVGLLAFQCGFFEEDFTESGIAKTRYGRFAVAVEQGKDGAWRFRHLTALADSVRP